MNTKHGCLHCTKETLTDQTVPDSPAWSRPLHCVNNKENIWAVKARSSNRGWHWGVWEEEGPRPRKRQQIKTQQTYRAHAAICNCSWWKLCKGFYNFSHFLQVLWRNMELVQRRNGRLHECLDSNIGDTVLLHFSQLILFLFVKLIQLN